MKNRPIIIRYILVMFTCAICFTTLHAQDNEQRYKVHGTIIDSRTHKPIQKIPIKVLPFNQIINADNKGNFLFNMPKGNFSLMFDYYPFDKQEVKLNVRSDTTLVIQLHSPFTSQYLGEVEAIASKPATDTPASIEQIDNHTLKVMPAMIGERDILKAFAFTAGVTSSSEGAADMQVRGGLHGQNLYLLDGVPLYSTEHFFGMVSVYNPTIIKSAKLYKSDFPAEYGGKISSVVNVLTEDANLKKFKGEAEIGLLTTKLALNIPLVKDKIALSIAGRLSNYSIANLISPFLSQESGTRFGIYFGDINANLVWKISEKDKLKLTFLSNTDGIDIQNIITNERTKFWMNNNQQNVGLNWYKTFSENTSNHLQVYTDNYAYNYGNSTLDIKTNQKQLKQIQTAINSTGLVDKLAFKALNKLNFTIGASIKVFGFSPYRLSVVDSTTNQLKISNQIKQTEGTTFAEGEYNLDKQQYIRLGLRLTAIGNQKKIYTSFEPRIGYHRIFSNDYSISTSVSRMTQPIHRVANSGLGFPFEMFFPSSTTLLPENSWNFSLGGAKDFSWSDKKLSLLVDGWYKIMHNMVDFQDGYDAVAVTLFGQQSNNFINNTEKYLTQGNGKTYGIDFTTRYNTKSLKLTANYTLMKAVCQFDNLNNGRPFAAPSDIRNSLSLTSEIKLSETWSFVAAWQYNSGRPITVPTFIFVDPNINHNLINMSGSDYQQVITERNNYRTKPFHKLDISFNHNYKTNKKHLDASISLGVYNLYNRANPFIYYIDITKNQDRSYVPVLKSTSLFPILPSFSWSVKF